MLVKLRSKILAWSRMLDGSISKSAIKGASLLFALLGLVTSTYLKQSESQHAKKPKEFSDQLAAMETAEKSLNTLLEFIRGQRDKIQNDENQIKELEAQIRRLEPLAKLTHDQVDALFKEQEARNQKTKWIDLVIGFFLGIITSLISSYIYSRFTPPPTNREMLADLLQQALSQQPTNGSASPTGNPGQTAAPLNTAKPDDGEGEAQDAK